MTTDTISSNRLLEELQHFNLESGRAASGFDLGRLLETAEQCSVIKKNIRRQVYRIQSGGKNYYLKRSTIIRTKDRIRLTLLPNRKKAEWRNLHRLTAMGVPVPTPLVRGEARHLQPPQFFLLTSEIEGQPVVLDEQADWRPLGEFIAFLHARGIYHADLHPGNIRLTTNREHALLDVQSVFFLRRLPRFLRLRNLGRFSMHFLYPDDLLLRLPRFLEGYNAGRPSPINMEEILASAQSQIERRYRSRTRRCLTDSSEFERVTGRGVRGFKRRGFQLDAGWVETAVREGTPLKPEAVFAHQGVCVKCRRRRLFHRDRCRTSWIMSRAMEVRGIENPRSIAYFVSGKASYFLSEFIEDGQLLNDFLSNLTTADKKRRALKALAEWIRRIHSSRLWQRDFKSSNIMHQNHRYIMLDMDSVRSGQPDRSQKTVNLAQLNASISNSLTLKDRLRFIHYYTSGDNWTRDHRRETYQRIWEISKSKNTTIYQLDLDKLLKEGGIGAGK